MGTVLSSFGPAAVGGGGVGGGSSKERAGEESSGGGGRLDSTRHDDCGGVRLGTPTPAEIVNQKQSPCKRTQWPCSNCHSMVGSDQIRCANCHGIQVKILHSSPPSTTGRGGAVGSSPPNFVYLERVVSPSGAPGGVPKSPSPSSPAPSVPAEPLQALTVESDDITTKEKTLGYYDDGEDSVASDYYDNDGMDDVETLEASPRPSDFAVVGDLDELRPMNPVAATLASVPSPVPIPLKLDATTAAADAGLQSLPMLVATNMIPEEGAGASTDGGGDKKRAVGLVPDVNDVGGTALPDDDNDMTIQLMPSKKKLRMS